MASPTSFPQWQDRAKPIIKQHCFPLSTENGRLSKSALFFSFPHCLECIVLSAEWMHRCIIYFLLCTARGNSMVVQHWCVAFCYFFLCFCSVVYQDGFYGAEIYVSILGLAHFATISTVLVNEGKFVCNVEDRALTFAEPNLSSWCWIFHKGKGQLRSPCANPLGWPFVVY